MTKLEELKEKFAQAKKTGNEGWLHTELLLYIAEALDDLRWLARQTEE